VPHFILYTIEISYRKEPLFYLIFSETFGPRKISPLPNADSNKAPKYQSVYYNSTRMILFTYVTTFNAFDKIPPTVFCSFEPNCCHFSQNFFFTTCPDDFPLLDVRVNFCVLPITSKQLF